jgi:hypothetical protein
MNDDSDTDLPLATRARNRRARLVAALKKLSADRTTERSDLQIAIDTIDNLLTGDSQELPDNIAHDVVTWLAETQYLALDP